MKRGLWRVMILLPLLVSLFFGGVSPAYAAVLLVDVGGSGGYTTIAAAVAAAQPGDVIQIKSGSYTENITLGFNGNLTLEAVDGPGTVTLNGGIDGAVNGTLVLNGIKFQASGDGINLSQVVDLLVVDCTFASPTANAIALDLSASAGTVALYNNTFSGLTGGAALIRASGGTYDLTLVDNKINNGAAMLMGFVVGAEGGSHVRLTIQGSTIAGVKGGGPAIYVWAKDSAALYASIHNNSLSNIQTYDNAALYLESSSSQPAAFDVTNNRLMVVRNAAGIHLGATGTGAVNASLVENELFGIGLRTSGYIQDRGIDVINASSFSSLSNIAILNNTLDLVDSSGIRVISQGGQMNATVLGNTLDSTNRYVLEADFDAEVNTTSGAALNLNLQQNTFPAAGSTANLINTTGAFNFTTDGSDVASFAASHNTNLPAGSVNSAGVTIVTTAPAAPTVNRPPVAADDAPSAVAKTATLFDVLANDIDPEGAALARYFYTPDSFQDGAVTPSGNQLSYTSPNFYLTSDTLYYIASDGQASDIAKVAVNVLPYPSPDLVISKVPGGAFFQGQTNATYTLTVQNNGQIATSGPVLVVDSLPSGLTLTDMSGAGWSCTVATRTCTRSDALAAGGATYPPITITASVAYDAPPVLTNTASVAYDGEYNTTNNTASAVTAIDQKPDLTLSKSHSGSFTQGQTGATFTLTAHNIGFAPSVGAVTVADTLPVGLTATAFSGVNWNCTLSPLSCTYSGPAIAAGADFPPLTLTVNVAADAADSLKNQADVSGGGETRTDNNHAEDSVAVIKVADLTIAKSHTDPFYQGQTGAAYTLHVTNLGPGSTAGAVAVDDTLPAGLTATAFSGTGWTCTLSPLHCTNSSVVAAGVAFDDLTLTVNVAFDAPAVITNTATVSGGGELVLTNDTASDPTNVTQKPDLTIVKSHTGNFSQGQTGATYNLVVTNSGYAPTSGTVTVVDTLPGGLTATDISGTGWSCTLATLTCTRSDELAVGGSYPAIVVTVNVAIGAPASVTNSATVSGGGETRTDNDTASDPTTIIQSADLTVSKTHGSNFIQGQTGATFSITVRNGGVGPTVGTVTVTDTLPSGLTASAFSGTGWTCTLSPLRCTSSDIVAAGANFPILTLTVNVASNAPASVVNTVRVGGGGEFDLTNDTATDTVFIDQLPDLTITKSHSGNFREGQVGAIYTIIVRNSGGAPTSGLVTVVDTLPGGLTATDISGTGWTCTLATLTCTRSDALTGGAAYPPITLTVNVATDTGPSLTNTATVSGGGETRTDNDTANNPTNIDQVADLTLAKSHTGNFSQGQIGATFTLTVTNAGQGPTIGTTTVVDTLPAGLTATAMSGSGWTCDLPTWTCTSTAAIPAGGNFPPITLTVDVSLNAASPQVNQATVSGGGELNTANDAASDSVTIIEAPNLVMTKTHTGNFYQGQAGATYTLRVQNTGTVATDGSQVTVVDTLPAGLTATALGGTGWTCDLPTLTCTRSNPLALGVGAFYEDILLTVNVAPTAPASLTNTATVSGGGEAYTPDSTAQDPTTIDGRADLTIVKTHTGNFRQGSTGQTFTLAVSNQGRADSAGTVSVVDTLPAGLTATAISGTGWTCTLATLTCTRSDALTGGAAYPPITLTVDVAADAAPLLINQASVSLAGEVNTANNSAQDGVTTIPVADLTISKSHTGNFRQGQQGAAYTLTVSNPGPGATLGSVTFTDTLPTGLSYAGVTANGWTCTNPQPQTVVCTRSDVIASGASYPALTLLVNVAENAPATVTNSVIVGGGGQLNPLNDSASDPTTIVQAADLAIAKTHSGSFTQGQTGATYTLHVSNLGPGATEGTVIVTDALPTGLTATAFSGTGWTCTLSPLRCQNDTILAAGASYPDLTLTVDVAADAPALVTNTAAVSGGGEINAANDTASDPTNIILRADLRLSKTANFSQVVPGQTFQYVLTFSNQGMGTAHNVVITDILPTGFQAAGVASTGVMITDTGHVPAYVWLVQDLAQGQSGSITIVGAFAQGTLPQAVVNQASITSTTIEAAPANNQSQVEVNVTRANTQMTLVYSPADPIVGQTITFTATVQTLAPVTIQATGQVTFTEGATILGTAPLDATGRAILSTSALSAGTHTITASYPGDALHGPSSVSVTLNIRPQADLSISLSVNPNSILSGKSVTFKADIANLGPLEAPGTLVEMALPAGFAFTPGGSSAGCASGSGGVTCSLASLAANQQASFNIVVNVTGQAPSGTTVFTAKVSAQAIDLAPANNTATASLNVIGFLNTYFNDFEQPVGAEWCQTRRDTTPIGARTFLGQFGNETACLTLNGLIPHQSVVVSFDLYLIRSWNGNSDDRNGQARSSEANEILSPDGTLGPDRWMFMADGQPILDTTFAVWPDDLQSFPYAFKMGAFPRFTQATENRTLGYYFALKANDAVYHLTYVFPHTASTINLDFLARNLQSLDNESWGLDNVQVSLFGQLGKLFLPILRLR